jgi:hypothetical protein
LSGRSEALLDAPENEVASQGKRCRKNEHEKDQNANRAENCPERLPEPDLGYQDRDQDDEQYRHGCRSVDQPLYWITRCLGE